MVKSPFSSSPFLSHKKWYLFYFYFKFQFFIAAARESNCCVCLVVYNWHLFIIEEGYVFIDSAIFKNILPRHLQTWILLLPSQSIQHLFHFHAF